MVLTFTVVYDSTRSLARTEVFDGQNCIASKIAHVPAELQRIGEDFKSLNVAGLSEKITEVATAWQLEISKQN